MDRHRLIMSGGHADMPDTQSPRFPWGIHPSKKLFMGNDGKPITYLGVTCFRGADRWARGEDIFSWLRRCFPRANVLRIFPYVPWAVNGWDAPPPGLMIEFVAAAIPWGFNIEITLLTDNNPRRIPWALFYIDILSRARLPNLLFEGGNEVAYNGIDLSQIIPALRECPYMWSSGRYLPSEQENDNLVGIYGTAHLPRERDFARRGHDLKEFWDGAGPDVPHTPSKWPWVGDEEIRPDQVVSQPVGTIPQNYRAHGATLALLGAGGTFHYGGSDGQFGGKQAMPPTAFEQECADEFFHGLTAFPADTALGLYDRWEAQPGEVEGARTYTVGNCGVRCWPSSPLKAGWKNLDAEGILIARS